MLRRTYLQALVATGCAAIDAVLAVPSDDRLRIGLTPVILADQVAFLSRWGKYLSDQIKSEVTFIARESYQVILDQLFSGQIDAAWICGYPFVRFESQLSLLSVPLFGGSPTYQAYLIRSRKLSSQIQGWSDLRNKVLAYSDPLSNSGWLVAQAELAKAGIATRDLKRTFFAHGHRNVAEAVASGLANAGSIDGYVWETMLQQNMAAVAQTEVVWKSESFGFPPIVSRRGVSHALFVPLQKALMQMVDDKEGRDLLRALNLTGFATGTPALYDSIHRQAVAVPSSGVNS